MKRLIALDPRAWEHPLDRAALARLRTIPGLETLILGLGRAVVDPMHKVLFARRARPASRLLDGKLFAAWDAVGEALDVDLDLPLEIVPGDAVNAAVVCAARPRVLLTEGLLAAADEQILHVVLAHEVGHLLSGHVPWKLGASVLLSVGIAGLGTGMGLAVAPAVLMTLRRWDRYSELSADRCAVLATQDPEVCQRVLWRLSGGEVPLSQFRRPEPESPWERARGLFRRHPRPEERAAALDEFVSDGGLARVLSGEYPRRGDVEARPWRGLFAAYDQR